MLYNMRSFILGLTLIFVFCIWYFSEVSINDYLLILVGVDYFYVCFFIIFAGLARFLAAYRFYYICSTTFTESLITKWSSCRALFFSEFVSLVIPGAIGAEGYRLFFMVNNGCSLSKSPFVIIFDRALGFLTAIVFCIVAIALNSDVVLHVYYFYLAGIIFALGLFFKVRISSMFCKFVDLSLLMKWTNLLISTLTSYISFVLSFYFANAAVGINIDISSYFILVFVFMCGRIIPFSIAGVGLSETGFAGMLVFFGGDVESVIVVSFILLCGKYFYSLIGGGWGVYNGWKEGAELFNILKHREKRETKTV